MNLACKSAILNRGVSHLIFPDEVPKRELSDPKQREYFNAIPTTLALPDEDIDAIRALAGQLLDGSKEFEDFTNSLNK